MDLELAVTVIRVGEGPPDLQRWIDSAYRTKYGDMPGSSMCTCEAVSTTLALIATNSGSGAHSCRPPQLIS